MRRRSVLALLLAALCVPVAPSYAAPSSSPEFVPFTGTRTLTATWGPPSGNYHSYPAIDIALPTGTPIYAAGAGTIVASHSGCPTGSLSSTCGIENLGNMIRIAHPDGRHSRYGHLSSLAVSSGNVSAGQLIGYSGSSGKSTGPHLHYQETNGAAFNAAVDPGVWVACHGGARVDYGNLQARVNQAVRNDGFGCAGNDPVGNYDTASSPEAGMVRVTGWAFDRDAATTPTEMHVYLGGQYGAGATEGHAFVADAWRPDVAAVHGGVGNAHGLDRTFETSRRGPTPVCVYAISIGPGTNPLLGCKTVHVDDPNPRGAYDQLTAPVGGKVRVQGWAFDLSARTTALQMHVYVGGRHGTAGVEGPHVINANVRRPDVGAAFAGVGDTHGFDSVLTTAKRGPHEVCVYAINVRVGANVLIGCKTATVANPPPAAPAPTPSKPTTPAATPVAPPVVVAQPSAPLRVLTRPAVRGTARVGRVLRCDNGTWSATPTSATWQWHRGGKAIRGARAQTYRVRKADRRRLIRCTVRVSTASGEGVATSASRRVR